MSTVSQQTSASSTPQPLSPDQKQVLLVQSLRRKSANYQNSQIENDSPDRAKSNIQKSYSNKPLSRNFRALMYKVPEVSDEKSRLVLEEAHSMFRQAVLNVQLSTEGVTNKEDYQKPLNDVTNMYNKRRSSQPVCASPKLLQKDAQQRHKQKDTQFRTIRGEKCKNLRCAIQSGDNGVTRYSLNCFEADISAEPKKNANSNKPAPTSPSHRNSFLTSLDDINFSAELKKSCKEKLHELSGYDILRCPSRKISLENLHTYYNTINECAPFKAEDIHDYPKAEKQTEHIESEASCSQYKKRANNVPVLKNVPGSKDESTECSHTMSDRSNNSAYYFLSPKIVKGSHTIVPIKNNKRTISNNVENTIAQLNARRSDRAIFNNKLNPINTSEQIQDEVQSKVNEKRQKPRKPKFRNSLTDMPLSAEDIEMRHMFDIDKIEQSGRVSKDLLLDNYYNQSDQSKLFDKINKHPQTPERPALAMMLDNASTILSPHLAPYSFKTPTRHRSAIGLSLNIPHKITYTTISPLQGAKQLDLQKFSSISPIKPQNNGEDDMTPKFKISPAKIRRAMLEINSRLV